MPAVSLKNVDKIYPNGVQAVFDFSLDIEEGEFVVLVGPSGCGKSTTLRMISGLEDISDGVLSISGRKVNNVAPKDRDIAMVFQNYALYAHMTVYHNMAFSLLLRDTHTIEIHKRVMWAAKILGLTPYLNRRPANLSGGQRQRVAVGRAIVRQPKVFLFDEPLSNLDAKLRDSMRKELKLLHHRLGATMIYVTHDQIEALTLADRIVIMKDGYIQQIGTPIDVYEHPVNIFVASFIGTPPMNFMSMTFNGSVLSSKTQTISLKYHTKAIEDLTGKGYLDKKVVLGVRPEDIIVEKKTQFSKGMSAKVINFELLGSSALIYFELGTKQLIAKTDVRENIDIGDDIAIDINLDKVCFFDPETENRI